jgi:hypothetical protein
MGFIAIDTWTSLQTNSKGEIAKIKDGDRKGQAVPVAELRVRITEGSSSEVFTLDKWRKLVSSKGNEFQINGAFTSRTGQVIPARSVCLSTNGMGDDLRVRKGEGEWITFHLQSGLAESFASVCEQTEIAAENWRNIKDS